MHDSVIVFCGFLDNFTYRASTQEHNGHDIEIELVCVFECLCMQWYCPGAPCPQSSPSVGGLSVTRVVHRPQLCQFSGAITILEALQ